MRTLIALITIVIFLFSAGVILAEKANSDKREIVVNPEIILQGGDTFDDAFPIPELPFSSTGTTCGYNEDYDVMCPYGAWAPDVVYVYTPTENHAVSINLCNGSDYDTKLMVFEDSYYNLVDCNDDYCTSPNYPYPYVSYLGRVALHAYHDYYIVVSGYGDECGDYVMEINMIEPCSECPPGGYAEGEPDCSGWYIDNYNGGCGSDPIVFQDIQIGDTICGLTGTINPSPFTDRDWYEIEVSYSCSLFWNAVSYDLEMMAQMFDAGSGDCSDHVQLQSDWGTYCDTIRLSASVEPGTYWMVARPLNDWISQPCPQEYVAWLDAYPICGDIGMTPDEYPIEVMPGGSFGYTGHLGNSTAYQQELDIWLMLETPGYGTYGPVNCVMDIPIESGQSLSYHFVQHVPNFAPAGEYEYIAYCGKYPDEACNQTSFGFTVLSGRKKGGFNNWRLQGSWFESSADNQGILLSAYPNPFNATTTITYNLTTPSYVSLDVYNLRGQKVVALIEEYQNASIHSIKWDASEQASGIYYYRLAIDDKSVTGRLILLK